MAQQSINIGSTSNDGTGDSLRVAFNKINTMFTELYSETAADTQVTISGNKISSNESNGNLVLEASGTGAIELEGIQIRDNHIEGTRSNDNLEISANGTGKVMMPSNLHLHSATPTIQFQRTDNANVPGISFLGADGVEGGSVKFDGTDGTTNEIILSSFYSSAVTERLRVTTTGAKVSGTLNVDGAITITDNKISASRSNDDLNLAAAGTGNILLGSVKINGTTLSSDDSSKISIAEAVDVNGNLVVTGSQIDFTNLPTSDPGTAGRLYRDGATVKVSV